MDKLLIDKKSTALVVIDLQKGIAQMETAPHPNVEVVKNAAALAASFRKNGMAVVLVHVVASEKERLQVVSDTAFPARAGFASKDFSEFVPELGQTEEDIVVKKKQWGAFYGTDLELQLRRRGIRTIVLCGIATDYGVESTARFAYEYGFQQIFAEDAMASMSETQHRVAVDYVFKRMGRVRSTQEILSEL
jgi:nicotinamidase-related amidase